MILLNEAKHYGEQKMNKKGQALNLNSLLTVGITLIVVGVALAFGLQVMGDIKKDMTADSIEANATADAITGVSKLTGKMPTIGLVVAAVIIIGLLVGAFAFGRR